MDFHLPLWYTIYIVRTRVDLLPVNIKQLRVSAFYRIWIKLGLGVQARARRTPEGYDIRIRYGKDDTIQKASVKVRETPIGAVKQLRPTLVCAGCGKFASKNLYLGSDFRFRCAKCLGVPQHRIRVPMQWDLGEEIRFRRLLRRKVDQDILQFELAALRTLKPPEFFASRPYLLPEWVDAMRVADAGLYGKVLKTLHGKYKSVMMRRRVQLLNEKEEQWLMEQLQVVMEKRSIMSKREIKWLRANRDLATGSKQKSQNLSLSQNGNPPSTNADPSSSPPSGTDTSLSRMSSEADTSAENAMVSEGCPVLIVGEVATEKE